MSDAQGLFEQDPFPGNPKILFIGLAESSHTHAWLGLLEGAELNIRLFAMPTILPPDPWPIRTYVTTSNLKSGLDPAIRLCLSPLPEELERYEKDRHDWIEKKRLSRDEHEQRMRVWALGKQEWEQSWLEWEARKQAREQRKWEWELRRQEWAARRQKQLRFRPLFLMFRASRKLFFALAKAVHYPFAYVEAEILIPQSLNAEYPPFTEDLPEPPSPKAPLPPEAFDDSALDALEPPVPAGRAESPDVWLARIVQEWRPDIIHTLGLHDRQGGEFYFRVRKTYGLEGIGKWVLQLRGGSDIALGRHNPASAALLLEVLSECDEILTDNFENIEYIQGLGLGHKIGSIAPVPGAGGVDTETGVNDLVPPSQRERIILWPKAYESPWSKALPVMEGIKLAWEQIQPCEVRMTASTPETQAWYWTLPEHMREHYTLTERIPRTEMLEWMRKSRVLLAPSLVDGVPNSLYEAMINGAFPIVSPLSSIAYIVQNEVNVLFARNLYPEEIREALVRAMTEDSLVDEAARTNLKLVKKIASRASIARDVIAYYEHF